MTRGDHARELLASPIIEDAFAAMERDIIDEWERCPARDADGKEDLWKLYKLSKKLKGVFEGYVQGGEMAKLHLDSKLSREVKKIFG